MATGKADAVFQVALVAALIKCCDFLIPGNIPIRILNPALSILLEGLAVALVFAYAERRNFAVGFASVFSMGVLWRAVFLFYLFLISLIDLPAALVTDGLQVSLRFLFLESFVNAILMFAYLKIEKNSTRCCGAPGGCLCGAGDGHHADACVLGGTAWDA